MLRCPGPTHVTSLTLAVPIPAAAHSLFGLGMLRNLGPRIPAELFDQLPHPVQVVHAQPQQRKLTFLPGLPVAAQLAPLPDSNLTRDRDSAALQPRPCTRSKAQVKFAAAPF